MVTAMSESSHLHLQTGSKDSFSKRTHTLVTCVFLVFLSLLFFSYVISQLQFPLFPFLPIPSLFLPLSKWISLWFPLWKKKKEQTSQEYSSSMAWQDTINLDTNPLTTAGYGNRVEVKVSQTQAKEADIPSLPLLAVPQRQEAIQPQVIGRGPNLVPYWVHFCELLGTLLSWFCGQCSPDVLDLSDNYFLTLFC